MQDNLYKACENKIKFNNISWNDLALLHDIPSGKILKDRFYRAKGKAKYKNNPETYKEETETSEIPEIPEYKNETKLNEDGTQYSDRLLYISQRDSKNPTFLLEAHGYDSEEWILVNAISNFWNGMRPDDMGLVVLQQSKILVRPRNESDFQLSDIDKFFEKYDAKSLSLFNTSRQYSPTGKVLEIALMDAHVGNESITFEQLKERVVDVIYEIKRKSAGMLFEKIILVLGGDIFHFDTYIRTTTGGTLVTYGSDSYTMYDNALLLMTWIINELLSISELDVVVLYGNHDKNTAYSFAKTLEAGFNSDNRVNIDVSHKMRKFRKIGSTSVAFIHGDMPKNNIYDSFQKEQRRMFGETLYSEIHLGHLHHEVSLEKSGVICRWLPSLTIPDQWHDDGGYTGAKQAVHCFVWDIERDGYVDIWSIPAKNQRV